MLAMDCPKLRRLSGRRVEVQGQSCVLLEDPHRLFQPVVLPIETYLGIVRHLDGKTSLAEIQRRLASDYGQNVPLDMLTGFVESLDRELVLEGPQFQDFLQTYRAESIRPRSGIHLKPVIIGD